MLIESYSATTVSPRMADLSYDGPVSIACGVTLPRLSKNSELTPADLADLKRKYSGLLIVFDRFRDKLIAAAKEDETAATEFEVSGATSNDWSLREMLGHMIDTDREIWWPRITAILETERPFLPSVDQQELLSEHAWKNLSVESILAQFMQFRWNCAIHLKDLTLQDFARTGVHYEFGDMTVANILEILVAHDAYYIAKLRATCGLPEF